MESVKKPEPIVKFVVTTYPPCKRFVRVGAVMAVITVEIGKAMAKVPERHKKTDVAPVENAEMTKVKTNSANSVPPQKASRRFLRFNSR
jgi:hypothetical protein